MKNLALQLYSINKECDADFKEALKRVAEIGFSGVEFAGYHGFNAMDLKELLKDFGLSPVSSHCNALEDTYSKIKYLNELEMSSIVVPHHSFENKKTVLNFAESMNVAGKIYKENGIVLGYHNHSHEFVKDENGKYLFDLFFENTDPDLVKMQMDVCWVKVAGENPVEYLRKYSDRIVNIHLKEVKEISPYKGTVIGNGMIDFKGIYEFLGKDFSYIVEQEDLGDGYEGDVWDSLSEGLRYLKGSFT